MRFALVLLLATLAVARAQRPQPASDAQPSFASATIKPHDPSDPCQNCSGFDTQGDRIRIRNKSAAALMQFAYAIQPRQIAGAPEWFFRQAYDISIPATAATTPHSPAEWQAIVQNLLTNCFAVTLHADKRDVPVYALQAVKGSIKLKPSAPDVHSGGGDIRNGNDETLTLTHASISDLLARLQRMTDLALVDQTGLAGYYDITLHFTLDDSPAPTTPNAPPTFFAAIKKQLGLKFQPTTAPIDVLVIDHATPPTKQRTASD